MKNNYLMQRMMFGNTLPGGYIARWRDGVDTIGVSISELYPLVDPALWSIISADGGATMRTDQEIVDLALAHADLNRSTMCGSAEEGVVFYPYLTTPVAAPATALTRACRYLGAAYTPPTGPDQFVITDQTGVELSTLITSAPVAVTGCTVSVAISATGLAYRLNGTGDFVTTPGIWSPGDTVEVQRLSDDDYEQPASGSLNINGVSDTFTVTTKAESSVVMGDVTAARISADGWFAEIDLTGFTAGGTYSLLPVDNMLGGMKMRFSVTTPGYDATGSPTTNTKTIYGTNYKRKITPDEAQADESLIDGGVTIRVALSDWIYSGDTLTMDLDAGCYNDGTATAASVDVPVTNNSAENHQRVVGNWSLPGFSIVGSSMDLRAVAFHRSARDAQPVKCVKFTVTDQHSHSVSTVVTSPTISSHQGLDAVPIIEYIGTIDTTSLTDGDTLTANFIAYPIDGNSGSLLDTSDGVNTHPTPRYAPQSYVLDKAGTYGRMVAVVNSTTGNNTTGALVALSSFDQENLPNAYLTISAAANAILAYNTANFSRSDTGGGVIYLDAGTHSWDGGATVSDPATWLTIEKLPGAVGDADIASASGTKTVAKKIKVSGIRQVSTSSITFTGQDYLWYHNCTYNPTHNWSTYDVDITYFTNCSLGNLDTYSSVNSLVAPKAMFRGCTSLAATAANYSDPYVFIGNNHKGVVRCIGGTSPYADNAVIAFNKFSRTVDGYFVRDIVSSGNAVVHGIAIVQNVFEQGATTSTAPLLGLAGDSTVSGSSNVLIWHNNAVGQRENMAYNDVNLNGGSPLYHKHWSIKHNMFDDANIVTDKDYHNGDPDPARIGNHSIIHGVGLAGNFDCARVGALNGYSPKYEGIYSVTPTASNTNPLYVDDNSTAGDKGGGGDYALQSGSAGKDRIPPGMCVLPFDINGYARSNAGGGDIGACLSGGE